MKQISKLLSTFFYFGYLPRSHATITSIAGFAIYEILLHQTASYSILIYCYLIPFIIGTLAVYYYLKFVSKSNDPTEVVLDELFAAALIPFFFRSHLILACFALVLFRILDRAKPGFIGKIDRWKHWSAIFFDDFAAVFVAILALKVVQIIIYGIE